MSTEPAAPPTRRRPAPWVVVVMLFIAVGTLAASILLNPPRTKPPVVEPPPADPVAVPPFALTERSGQPVNNADLLGKVWLGSFVFSRCTGPCPSVSATMAKLQADYADKPDFRLVTFTFDPTTDTPAELKKYADHFRADADRWLFLTGSEDELHRLARDTFKLAVNRNADPAADPGKKFEHTTYVTVVDKKGRVRGHFSGFRGEHDTTGEHFADSQARLRHTIDTALAE